MNIKIRLTVMNFLQFAVWGAYLTSINELPAVCCVGSVSDLDGDVPGRRWPG